jgi:hypothetical protein
MFFLILQSNKHLFEIELNRCLEVPAVLTQCQIPVTLHWPALRSGHAHSPVTTPLAPRARPLLQVPLCLTDQAGAASPLKAPARRKLGRSVWTGFPSPSCRARGNRPGSDSEDVELVPDHPRRPGSCGGKVAEPAESPLEHRHPPVGGGATAQGAGPGEGLAGLRIPSLSLS